MQQTIILCPLYNDEASFNQFAAAVEKLVGTMEGHRFSFLVVNDGTSGLSIHSSLPLTIIHLHRNIGHQKAIAIGLSHAHQQMDFDQIIVADCDGEDRPEDIVKLAKQGDLSQGIVVAKRASRQEGTTFSLFYILYKLMFFILTGKRIAFGNFMLLPKKEVAVLVFHDEIWNHLAGAVLKSGLIYTSIKTHRGQRYAGESKMNFASLLLHGLGAIGVFIELIASRLLMLSLLMILLSVIAIGIILFIKAFTTRAIPGWATTALSSTLIVLLQSFLLSLFTIFLYLSFQGQRKFIPAHHYKDYVRDIETVKHD